MDTPPSPRQMCIRDSLGTVDVPEGGDATPYAPEPEEFEDMVFIGWSSDITNITYDKTVRPRYHSLYKVTFMNYAGTEALSVQTVEETYDAVPPEPEVISGMTFVEWDADYTNVQSDLTIHPVYEVSGFTVRFLNYAGDDLLSEQYVDKGGDAVPPAPEKITGMIFIGWSAPFREIDSDRTIRPRYRAVPPNPALNFYEANADGSSGDLLKTYKAVNACSIVQKLSGECTVDVRLLTRQSEGYVDVNSRLEVEGLIFNITQVKKNISGGMCYTQFTGEHVSYILNNEEYKVEAFDMSGTAKDILATLLLGTPFNVGTVDIETMLTLRIKMCIRDSSITARPPARPSSPPPTRMRSRCRRKRSPSRRRRWRAALSRRGLLTPPRRKPTTTGTRRSICRLLRRAAAGRIRKTRRPAPALVRTTHRPLPAVSWIWRTIWEVKSDELKTDH